ncbi:MAG: imidazolonepropionase [Bdellovibrionales bacterium]|nr:imidazolonepropionase [Bdellovibrionales bacterium]
MARLLYKNIACLVTNEPMIRTAGIRPQEAHLGLISRGAVAWDGRKILWAGSTKSIPKIFRGKSWRPVECSGLVAYPGLVDCHTHAVFAGDRSREFQLRMRGATYQEIAAAGGGILSTMRATRAASRACLADLARNRFRAAAAFGVRLLEVKSGYGLRLKDEVKCLEAVQEAAVRGLEIYPTCLAAHALPPEFRGKREEYVRQVCEDILPLVARRGLARSVDVFCDEGFFTLSESRAILEAGRNAGLAPRLHGEELALTGAAELAAELGALSVDHLLKVSPAGIRSLAESGTVGVLLPGTALYLREPPAPARALIDAGVRVALASDFNPGTCPTQNLPFVGTLAALQLGMSTAEIIAALTWNAAQALGMSGRYGAVAPGSRGEPVFCEGDHPSALFYRMAPAALPRPT